jgi:molybdopterin-containing oxidoreductase family iron-sulfur binding subunit
MAYRWGMAVDLDKCTGCEACVTACHAENNIPTVSAEQAARGRAMHWIRVERYYEGDFPDVRVKFRPVLVPALRQRAVRSGVPDLCGTSQRGRPQRAGLQPLHRHALLRQRLHLQRSLLQLLQPEWPKPLQLQLNPDVSVREVGVMEKCTFCVQRIKAAKTAAKAEKRRSSTARFSPRARRRVRRRQLCSATSTIRRAASPGCAIAAWHQAPRGPWRRAEDHLSAEAALV